MRRFKNLWQLIKITRINAKNLRDVVGKFKEKVINKCVKATENFLGKVKPDNGVATIGLLTALLAGVYYLGIKFPVYNVVLFYVMIGIAVIIGLVLISMILSTVVNIVKKIINLIFYLIDTLLILTITIHAFLTLIIIPVGVALLPSTIWRHELRTYIYRSLKNKAMSDEHVDHMTKELKKELKNATEAIVSDVLNSQKTTVEEINKSVEEYFNTQFKITTDENKTKKNLSIKKATLKKIKNLNHPNDEDAIKATILHQAALIKKALNCINIYNNPEISIIELEYIRDFDIAYNGATFRVNLEMVLPEENKEVEMHYADTLGQYIQTYFNVERVQFSFNYDKPWDISSLDKEIQEKLKLALN
jgi:hypothetical protein